MALKFKPLGLKNEIFRCRNWILHIQAVLTSTHKLYFRAAIRKIMYTPFIPHFIQSKVYTGLVCGKSCCLGLSCRICLLASLRVVASPLWCYMQDLEILFKIKNIKDNLGHVTITHSPTPNHHILLTERGREREREREVAYYSVRFIYTENNSQNHLTC